MPRAKNPQQAVLDYFETAELSQAQATAGFVSHILKRRAAAEVADSTAKAWAAIAPKKRKKPGPKPGMRTAAIHKSRKANAEAKREITPTTPTPVSEAN